MHFTVWEGPDGPFHIATEGGAIDLFESSSQVDWISRVCSEVERYGQVHRLREQYAVDSVHRPTGSE